MKNHIKDKINSLNPIVREKLLKRLAAESLAKKYNLEINFNQINQDDYIDSITKAQIIKDKNLTELTNKADLSQKNYEPITSQFKNKN